jgi:3'-5' exoribonuclease
MEKTWVKDVKEGERVKALFAVSRKAVPTAKSGKSYLSVTLVDRTGELEARAFDRVEEIAALFEEKDVVEAEGLVGTFQGKPQLRIESIAKADPAASGADAADFVWMPPPEPKKPEKPAADETASVPWSELLGLVEAITDPHVKLLVKAFLEDDDVAGRLRRAPAAKGVHHAYPGGLLEHTVSCIKLSHRIADHYPQLDRDLLVAGAFFHDLGKIRELTYERAVEYGDEGRLVGHLVMAAQWIHDKARRTGVPRELEQHVVHLVLSHHGKLEYGSPKTPATLEALVTHFIDDLDSRMNSWVNLMGRDGGSRRWTDANNVYGHPIWRGQLPTAQVEKKGPPPELMTPVIYVPRDAGTASGEPRRGAQAKKPRPPRPPRPEARPAEGTAPAPEAAAAPRAEGVAPVERPPRPERADRPDRGPRGPGAGPGGPRGPGDRGDRKPRYMGPRLPGDKGPSARPEKPRTLTHNPFAALAARVEGGAEPTAEVGAAPEPPASPPPVAEIPEPEVKAPEAAPTAGGEGGSPS